MDKETLQKIYAPLPLFFLIIMGLIIFLTSLAAIFPATFESMGIFIFHNRQKGVFGDCWLKPGVEEPVCRSDYEKERFLQQKEAAQKHTATPRELLPSAAEKPKKFGKIRIMPFSLSE